MARVGDPSAAWFNPAGLARENTAQISGSAGVYQQTSITPAPGLTLNRSGAVTLDGLLDSGTASMGASVFDPDADLDYHLPWEFQGGAAWVRSRIELEFDLHAYSADEPIRCSSRLNRCSSTAGQVLASRLPSPDSRFAASPPRQTGS